MRNNERGQAVLLVLVALAIFLLGAVGLAVDGSQLYAHRQMAQAAADAAAQAGLFSIYAGTLTTDGSSHTCTSTDTSSSTNWTTPCQYAANNGFSAANGDTVQISFPGSTCGTSKCFNGVTGSANYGFPFEQVKITRAVPASFMRFFGTTSSSVVAIGVAGIVQATSPIPIAVLHPTLPGAMSLSNNTTITICGGAKRSITINSISSTALSINSAVIDLSHAGPLDDVNNPCHAGTGADFGVVGGPTTQPGASVLKLGTLPGKYIQPAVPFKDPLATVPAPCSDGTCAGAGGTKPLAAAAKVAVANGKGGCPAAPLKPCNQYFPGYYSSGLTITNETALFSPGLYYVDGGDFGNGSNGQMFMCVNDSTATPAVVCGSPGLTGNLGTGNGMMVYLHNDGTHDGNFNVGANSNATLVGSDDSSTYKGILFFEDHNAMNHRGQGSNKAHSIGAGAIVNLTGTIYTVNRAALRTNTYYQDINFGGNASSLTTLKGEIITDALSMSGGGGLTMELDPAYTFPVDQIALIK